MRALCEAEACEASGSVRQSWVLPFSVTLLRVEPSSSGTSPVCKWQACVRHVRPCWCAGGVHLRERQRSVVRRRTLSSASCVFVLQRTASDIQKPSDIQKRQPPQKSIRGVWWDTGGGDPRLNLSRFVNGIKPFLSNDKQE